MSGGFPVVGRVWRSVTAMPRELRTSADPRRVPRQDRSRARVASILSSARRLVGERGSDAVSMREIAVDAGVPIASVYQYFPDKTAVLRALTERFYRRIRDRLVAALPLVTSPEQIPDFTAAMVDGLAVELGAAREHLNIWSACQVNETLRSLDAADALELATLLEARFREIGPTLDPDAVRDACSFAVMMAGHVVRVSYTLPPDDGARLLREFKALIRLRVESVAAARPPRPAP